MVEIFFVSQVMGSFNPHQPFPNTPLVWEGNHGLTENNGWVYD